MYWPAFRLITNPEVDVEEWVAERYSYHDVDNWLIQKVRKKKKMKVKQLIDFTLDVGKRWFEPDEGIENLKQLKIAVREDDELEDQFEIENEIDVLIEILEDLKKRGVRWALSFELM